MSAKGRFVRVLRVRTWSWITYELPGPMTMAEAKDWLARAMPGWEVVTRFPTPVDEEAGS